MIYAGKRAELFYSLRRAETTAARHINTPETELLRARSPAAGRSDCLSLDRGDVSSDRINAPSGQQGRQGKGRRAQGPKGGA